MTIPAEQIHLLLDDDAANPAVVDWSGNGHDGVASVNTSVLHIGGLVGSGAFAFDGSTYVNDLPVLGNTTGARVICCWVRTSTTTSLQFMVGEAKNGWVYTRGVGIALDGSTLCWSYGFVDGDYRLVSSDEAIADGTWHHLALIIDDVGMRTYVDGEVDVTDNAYTVSDLTPAVDLLQFGVGANVRGVGDGPIYFFTGDVDGVRTSKEPLTQAHVQAIYNGGAGTPLSLGQIFAGRAHYYRTHLMGAA